MILKLKRTPGVFLVGFMGSGKTTIGRLLAERIGWPFADLDDDIEREAHQPIGSIFSTCGEPEFRRLEHEALTRRIRPIGLGRPLVLALGGGAFIQPANQSLLSYNGISVWLDCPIETIEKRLNGSTSRPLARDKRQMRELFDTRQSAYALADYRIDATADDPLMNVEALLQLPLFK